MTTKDEGSGYKFKRGSTGKIAYATIAGLWKSGESAGSG
jgi:hypothetical protein